VQTISNVHINPHRVFEFVLMHERRESFHNNPASLATNSHLSLCANALQKMTRWYCFVFAMPAACDMCGGYATQQQAAACVVTSYPTAVTVALSGGRTPSGETSTAPHTGKCVLT
jgi:hypothetical protein